MTHEEYLEHPALSRSGIRDFLRGPNYYFAKKAQRTKETPSMAFGTAIHTAYLEPDRFDKEYVQVPEGLSLSSKAGREFKKEHEDKKLLKYIQWGMLQKMVTNLNHHPFLSQIRYRTEVEPTYVYDFEGIALKTRPDMVAEDAILDIKTTLTLDERKIAYSIKDYRYDIQAAMAIDGIKAVEGVEYKKFYFVFIEKCIPYDIKIIKLAPENTEKARNDYRMAALQHKECLLANMWPSMMPKEPVELNVAFIEPEYNEDEVQNNEHGSEHSRDHGY